MNTKKIQNPGHQRLPFDSMRHTVGHNHVSRSELVEHATFNKAENWHGSYYELCIELGPSGHDDRLLAALRRLWSFPALGGPWSDRDSFGTAPCEVTVSGDLHHFYYGTLAKLDADTVGCLTCVAREPDGSDWLDLCIPTGMLEIVCDIQYPLYFESNPWIPPLNSLFVDIANHVHAEVGFRLAIIGEETSGLTDAASLTKTDLERGLFLLPETLARSLGVEYQSQLCSQGLYRIGITGG